ncbi:efflux RND transporter periplasmic adaptor subunit [Marinobacterium rhizophilum]|uniref:Efflux RND transporter periplasmic adaptor subunit n=1 Tax=Marinobacterium rhizophilum TaxID=420402 RepID=A0ABY5HHG8_9GAMM|nr:efflux RND transporter periplasmic adaptor subunit [Marinobacterium rhizophilum]UTW10742.1 efflux RND transporter periplasmic adaptor subunit [Marinobacterium rhizophilum]
MIRKLLPVAVLAAFVAVAALIMFNRPEASRNSSPPVPSVRVDVQVLQPRDYQVQLQSYGTVRPRTQSTLLPQVSGEVLEIGPNFREGGFFEPGDLLLRIDARDYAAALATAQANQAEAEQLLQEEQAQAQQALQDWKRLGNTEAPPALVSRQPQLAAAKASLKSAQAAVAQAQLNLDRTRIVAPFAGRVLSKSVDVGQLVSSGTTLAEIYAIDYVEVRLPLKNRDLEFMRLPEAYRFDSAPRQALPAVSLHSTLAGSQRWQGQVVRTEGAIDTSSQQLHVVAVIDDPYGLKAEGRQPLKINQYVSAEIEGRLLPGVLVIPNSTLYQGSYVYLVDEGLLRRQEVEVLWQNDTDALVGAGLKAGDMLVTTALGQVSSGTRVQLQQDPADAGSGAGARKGDAQRQGGGS